MCRSHGKRGVSLALVFKLSPRPLLVPTENARIPERTQANLGKLCHDRQQEVAMRLRLDVLPRGIVNTLVQNSVQIQCCTVL